MDYNFFNIFDLINFCLVIFLCYLFYHDGYSDRQDEIDLLKDELSASETNEETFRLEMQEITKILGLEEDTLFDDVKQYAKQLKEQLQNKGDD